jgi:uncharacterized membrane protein
MITFKGFISHDIKTWSPHTGKPHMNYLWLPMFELLNKSREPEIPLLMALTFIQRIYRIPAHTRLVIALLVSFITFFLSSRTPPGIQFILIWSSFSLSSLLLFWITIFNAEVHEVKYIAKREDSSRTIVFIFVLVAAIIGLFAVIFLLKILPDRNASGYWYHIVYSIISVVLSWALIHTVFTFRYAHLYYTCRREEQGIEKEDEGGLQFPGEDSPDYLDFAYFSFVIGMTFQVSDVAVTSRQIRHLVLFHGLISFVYNTVILALSVSIIAGLVHK